MSERCRNCGLNLRRGSEDKYIDAGDKEMVAEEPQFNTMLEKMPPSEYRPQCLKKTLGSIIGWKHLKHLTLKKKQKK